MVEGALSWVEWEGGGGSECATAGLGCCSRSCVDMRKENSLGDSMRAMMWEREALDDSMSREFESFGRRVP